MASPSFLLREFFHLSFLRLLSLRLAGRAYAVKGGICLRFFHASPRLSEDMDLDASPDIRPETLAKGVDTVLDGAALFGHLAPRGVSRLTVSKPKQTATTQRWKVTLETPGGPVGTKIEFSRRTDKIPASESTPLPEILLAHGSVPFAARFYDGPEMVKQKVRAMAAPARNAARDLFDLHHLLYFRQVPRTVLNELEPKILLAAAAKATSFSFQDFQAQVAPYLTEEMIGAYRVASAFKSLQEQVKTFLREKPA
jgi:predicted nucleotidyltransferase component of viral defense system